MLARRFPTVDSRRSNRAAAARRPRPWGWWSRSTRRAMSAGTLRASEGPAESGRQARRLALQAWAASFGIPRGAAGQ